MTKPKADKRDERIVELEESLLMERTVNQMLRDTNAGLTARIEQTEKLFAWLVSGMYANNRKAGT